MYPDHILTFLVIALLVSSSVDEVNRCQYVGVSIFVLGDASTVPRLVNGFQKNVQWLLV